MWISLTGISFHSRKLWSNYLGPNTFFQVLHDESLLFADKKMEDVGYLWPPEWSNQVKAYELKLALLSKKQISCVSFLATHYEKENC